jgi:hypothetical protein
MIAAKTEFVITGNAFAIQASRDLNVKKSKNAQTTATIEANAI